MHDHYQVHFTRNQLVFAHQFTSGYSRAADRIFRKEWVKTLVHKTREAAVFCLAALTVGMLLLGGVSFFLIQLASYGW